MSLTGDDVRAALHDAEERVALAPLPAGVAGEALRLAGNGALRALHDHADSVAAAGLDVTALAASWWAAVDPTSDPPLPPLNAEAGITALEGATDALIDREDARKRALRVLREALLDAGRGALRLALPVLVQAALAAVRK